MKYIIWILVFSYGLASFKSVGPVLNYYMNQDYIAKNLCENIDKPVLKCNGKCYLAKELAKVAKEQEDESGTPQSKKIKQDWNQIVPEKYVFTGYTTNSKSPIITSQKALFNRAEIVETPPPNC